jgi:hypothetical protein
LEPAFHDTRQREERQVDDVRHGRQIRRPWGLPEHVDVGWLGVATGAEPLGDV